MLNNATQSVALVSRSLSLVLLLASLTGLIVAFLLVPKIEADGPAGFLTPYKDYLSVISVLSFGIPTIQTAARLTFAIAQRHTSTDVARAFRVIARLVGYGLLFSFLISILTDNSAAALATGGFTGLVVGFASRAVAANAIAGLFIAIERPIELGDNVNINNNSGTVADITLMHIILETNNQAILIPSSEVVSSVLIKNRMTD